MLEQKKMLCHIIAQKLTSDQWFSVIFMVLLFVCVWDE